MAAGHVSRYKTGLRFEPNRYRYKWSLPCPLSASSELSTIQTHKMKSGIAKKTPTITNLALGQIRAALACLQSSQKGAEGV